MKLTIIGASLGVGLLAVQQVLIQGHHVTTRSRTITTLPEHPQLTKVVGGRATSVADLRQVLPGAEAGLSGAVALRGALSGVWQAVKANASKMELVESFAKCRKMHRLDPGNFSA
jgi:putative NADH-flavin reductase